MSIRRSATRAVTILTGLVAGMPAPGDAQVVIAGVRYESPTLLVPLVLAATSSAGGSDRWTLALTGSTGRLEWTARHTPSRATLLGVELTPVSANGSRYLYRDGKRVDSLAFHNQTYRVDGGLRFLGGERWRVDVRGIGLIEAVHGLSVASLGSFWRRPFVGLGVDGSYGRVSSDDVLESRWGGLRVSGDAAALFGRHAWWKSRLSAGAGRELSRFFLRVTGSLLAGGHLNVVSQHLVGGCWDRPDAAVLYGYHNAEFRVSQAAVVGAGLDVRLLGTWELGLRAGYLGSPATRTSGTAVRLGGIWNGIAFHAGAGRSAERRVMGFAGVTAAVVK